MRPVVLAGSGVVFMENDVERPVQGIFDPPRRALDFEGAIGRETLGESEMVDAGGGFALARLSLGFDACEGGQTGKGRRILWRGDHAGAAALAPVMSALGLLAEGERAIGVGRRERLQGAGAALARSTRTASFSTSSSSGEGTLRRRCGL